MSSETLTDEDEREFFSRMCFSESHLFLSMNDGAGLQLKDKAFLIQTMILIII